MKVFRNLIRSYFCQFIFSFGSVVLFEIVLDKIKRGL